jgi:conjugative transposon TraJ protein
MAQWKRITLGVVVGMVLPFFSKAQGVADSMKGLHGVLEQLYDEMIPLCSKLIGVGQGLAGFAALWYISSRVWRHLANAEPIDFYPLFRPFVVGFCVMVFPSVLAMINGVMKPTVSATAEMVKGSDNAIALLLKQKEDAIKKTDQWQMYVGEKNEGDKDKWYKYTHKPDEKPGLIDGIGNDVRFAMSKAFYNFNNSVKQWMSEILRVLFEAASLCIDTLRTFQLVVLAIIGPLAFGIAVFDGFQHTLTSWIARYLNIYLWLPVANIFGAIIGKVQEQMIKLDLSQINTSGDTVFSSTDIAYLVFMIIGIVGYLTVPSVANFIVNAGGGGALGQKVTSMMGNSATNVVSKAGDTGAAIKNAAGHFNEGYSGTHSGSGISGSVGRGIGNTGAYMADKLSGSK